MNRHLAFAIKVAFSAGLLGYLLRTVDLADLSGQMMAGRQELFLVAVLIYFTVVLLSTLRWKVLLDPLGRPVAFWPLTQSYLVSAFFANFLPSNIGGDVVRVREAAKAAGSATASLTVTAFDRIMGFLALYFIAAPAYLLGGPLARGLSGAQVILAGMGIVFAGLIIMFLNPGLLDPLISGISGTRLEAVAGRLAAVRRAVDAYRADRGAMRDAFLLSLLLQFLGVLYFFVVARALRIPLDFGTSLLMVPLCTLIQAIPVSFNGWGLREGLYVFYFKQVGLSRESALAFSIMAATLVVVLSLSGLVVWLVRRSGMVEESKGD